VLHVTELKAIGRILVNFLDMTGNLLVVNILVNLQSVLHILLYRTLQ